MVFTRVKSIGGKVTRSVEPGFGGITLVKPTPFGELHVAGDRVGYKATVIIAGVIHRAPLGFEPLMLVGDTDEVPGGGRIAITDITRVDIRPGAKGGISTVFPRVALPGFAGPARMGEFFNNEFI